MARKSEYEVIRDIMNDIFDLQKRYMYCWLDDFRWEYFLSEIEEKSQKYKKYGDGLWKLYRNMASAIVSYKQLQQEAITKMGIDMTGGKQVNRAVEEKNDERS